MGKIWRPRRPAEAPLEAVGVKDAQGVAVEKMWRPRPRRPAKTPLEAVDAQGVAVITVDGEVGASVLGAPAVAAARGRDKGPLEDGTAVCLMGSVDGDPVIAMTRQKVVGVKDAQGAAMGKMWRPRRPAKVTPKAVGVKDAKGVAVIGIDAEVEASGPAPPVVAAVGGSEKVPLEDGIAICLNGDTVITTTRQEPARVKDARGVVVGKVWRPRRPAKAPLKAVHVKDAEGVAGIVVDGEVEASVLGAPLVVAATGGEKGPLEDGTKACPMDSLHGALVISTTRQEVKGVKDTKGVVGAKIWRPCRPAKVPLEVVGVKDAEGVAVIAIDGKVEASVQGASVVTAARDGEKGPLDEGIAVCQMDALDGAPVIATTRKEAVGVKGARGVAVGKIWRPRRPAKAPLEALGVQDAEGVAVSTIDEKVEESVLGAPVVVAAAGSEQGPLEERIVVCKVDTLDGDPVVTTTEQEVVGVKDAEEVAVGKMWRPRRPAKAPLEAVGVKDGEGVAVITLVGEVEPLVLGVPLVATTGDGEKGSLEDGIVVCPMDSLIGAPVISTDEKEEVSVQGDPVFLAIDQKVNLPVVEGMQEITVEGNAKEDKDNEGIKWLKHYSTAQSILIIGDGDFSFSLALATTFGSGGNLVATSLDTYGALTLKYGKAESNVRELERLGATVLHGVDAETMKFHTYLEMRRFDRIVFNFPHAGFKGKEDQLHVINAHKQLVRGFLANARQLLRPYGEIHISQKKGLPYDAWGIKKLAHESGLIMVRKVEFSKEDYPGYNQKRGDGPTCDESFPLGPCCTFMFRAGDGDGDVERLKRARGNSKVGPISSCLGDSEFYPGISDIMWPFHLHHPAAWPQPHLPSAQTPIIAFDPFCPFGVSGMEDPSFNCYGTSFHPQGMVQPTCWYQEGPPVEPPWTSQEHQSLQWESVEKQAMLEMLIQVYGRN